MYQLLVLLTGVVLAAAISVNGQLSEQCGVYAAAAIIHLVGSVFALILCCFQKSKRQIFRHAPWWIYLGGAIGAVTTIFQNIACCHISLTSIVSLCFLGQTVTSLTIDSFGLLGMTRHPFKKTSLVGLVFALAGVIVMIDSSVSASIASVALAFFSGVSCVMSRSVNARLALKTGALRSSLVNHLVGLPITVILAVIMASKSVPLVFAADKPWLYVGGMLGVCIVLLYNITVPKVASVQLTVLSFVSQVFAGVLIDITLGSRLDASFYGGLIIAVGIIAGFIVERIYDRKKPKEE